MVALYRIIEKREVARAGKQFRIDLRFVIVFPGLLVVLFDMIAGEWKE